MADTHRTLPTDRSKIKVRIGKGYPVPFVLDLGQRNADFVSRAATPLRHVFRFADAFAVLEPGGHMIHTLNSVPLLTRRPFVTTFEDYMPRVPEDRYVGWVEHMVRRTISSDRCVALIAISEYALRQFRWQNRDYAALGHLEEKTELVYPAVALRRTEPKQPGDRLRLLFVGRDFMHKGAPAVVRAHARVMAEGVPIETTIVSSLRWDPREFIGPPNRDLVDDTLRRFHQPGITHRGQLPNAEVMRLMEESDFLVLPTFHDTFGYVTIEALAAGTPVIATATCALPEVVEHGRSGYLLPLDNDEHVGKWTWTYRHEQPGYTEAYAHEVDRLGEALTDLLLTCWETRDRYEEMSAAAIARVRERFDRETARDRLETLYEKCVGR